VKYYVLVYDRSKGRVLEDREHVERERALEDRARAIALHIAEPTVEVVLLGATSREELMRTHSRYFQTVEEITSAD
jgi:hypothetical protein